MLARREVQAETKKTNSLPEEIWVFTSAMHKVGIKYLQELREDIWDQSITTCLLASSGILPDQTIDILLNYLFTISTVDDVVLLIGTHIHLLPFAEDLFKCLDQMQRVFSLSNKDMNDEEAEAVPHARLTPLQVA